MWLLEHITLSCEYFTLYLLASNAVVNSSETGVYAVEPVFQLSTDARWTGGLSVSSATADLRIGAAISV